MRPFRCEAAGWFFNCKFVFQSNMEVFACRQQLIN
jgi:hypothetical protein